MMFRSVESEPAHPTDIRRKRRAEVPRRVAPRTCASPRPRTAQSRARSSTRALRLSTETEQDRSACADSPRSSASGRSSTARRDQGQLLQLVFDRSSASCPCPSRSEALAGAGRSKAALEERETLQRRRIAQLLFSAFPSDELQSLHRMDTCRCSGSVGLSERVTALAGGPRLPVHRGVRVRGVPTLVGAGARKTPRLTLRGASCARLRSLPADRFPNVVALAVPLTDGGPDERFVFGVEVLIDGLIAQSQREQS